eukprot:2786298-Rhodomonas_salina.4
MAIRDWKPSALAALATLARLDGELPVKFSMTIARSRFVASWIGDSEPLAIGCLFRFTFFEVMKPPPFCRA